MLWDVQAKRELWMAEIGDQLWYLQPQWSPDGTQFVVGIPPALYDPVFELFVVDREGKRTQLTHFKDTSARKGTIFETRWSPDGRYIAFWLTNSLAVFDMMTGMVRDYCLPSNSSMNAEIYWSPDSEQVVFSQSIRPYYGPLRVIVIDIQKNRAVEVARNHAILGWMTGEP